MFANLFDEVWIAAAVHDQQAWLPPLKLKFDVESRNAGHREINNRQIDRLMRKGRQGGIQIVSCDRAVSEIVKHVPCRFAHARGVIHNENVPPCAHARSAQLAIFARTTALVDRGNPVHPRQPKFRSLAGLLGPGAPWNS